MTLSTIRHRGNAHLRLLAITFTLLLSACTKRGAEPAVLDGDPASEHSAPRAEEAPGPAESAERKDREGSVQDSARLQAIEEARDFGMIGKLNSGAAPEAAPQAASAPLDKVSKSKARPSSKRQRMPASGLGLSGMGRGSGTGHAAGYGAGHGRLRGSRSASTRGSFSARSLFNTERYADQPETGFVEVAAEPLSTFSADVDTASYANVRRFLKEGRLPPAGAVRIEELLNYFSYNYPAPNDNAPFGVHTEVSTAPWNAEHKLVHVGIRTAKISASALPPRNLVFLLDVSGSMSSPDKLPLLQRSMRLLVDQLREEDRVSIVVYAGAAGVVLAPTSGADKGRIRAALSNLRAGGGTNGAQGIVTAYELAAQNFKKGGVNRVILATDGDFNLGTTSESELVRLIEKKRKSAIFLTVLGLGRGNLNDSMMEKLADKGNGNYAYLDSFAEAKKVLQRESGATLVTVAKDLKFQAEFNPMAVSAYRLIGYENRRLAAKDFNDDTKDAGEVGAGHTVTALYEVIPRGVKVPGKSVDALKYQKTHAKAGTTSKDLLTIKIRYKKPNEDHSRKLTHVVKDLDRGIEDASYDHRFAAAVAEFGLLLRKSKDAGSAGWQHAHSLAQSALGSDPHGQRAEFLGLIRRAQSLSGG